MMVHVVKKGETIFSIADYYRVSASRIAQDNELNVPYELVIGQTIVITFPEKMYTVQEGDTISSIANSQEVTILQLLRNNPGLYNRKVYTGESIVIRYNHNGKKLKTNGFIFPFINHDILRKTLPYLTYLSIFGYQITEGANIKGNEDAELIKMARDYGVAPLMSLSSLSIQGAASVETAYSILYNDDLQERLVDNILYFLKQKGYYGFNITYYFIDQRNIVYYENLTKKLVDRLHYEGYPVFITLPPKKVLIENKVTYESIDYSNIVKNVDSIITMNFNWGYSYDPPAPVFSINNLMEYLENVISQMMPEKIDLGLPVIGYDWQLPYTLGVTKATSLTLSSVLSLAKDKEVIIKFDKSSQTPYFNYLESKTGFDLEHIVWFIDARSIKSQINLIPTYNLAGTGVWNIMEYVPQIWLIINSQYEIENV